MQIESSDRFQTLAQFLPTGQENVVLSHASSEVATRTYQVLILDHSGALARLIATGLVAEALCVYLTYDLDSAMSQLRKGIYHLLILNLDLPDQDGFPLLRSLQSTWPEMRILVLTGQGVHRGVEALDHGADDYLMKPFSLLELMARVRNFRRRWNDVRSLPKPGAKGLILHPDQCRVERDGRQISLTPREFSLLSFMMENAGKTLSRALLTEKVWNLAAEANTNIVDVYVKYLRDKIDDGFDDKIIRTVRGMGYLLQVQG